MQEARDKLREQMTLRRRALDPATRMSAAQGLRRNLETLDAFTTAPRIAAYWACHGELPLNLVLAAAAMREQHIFLPRIEGPRQMLFAPWKLGDPVEPNRYGIPEPVRAPDTQPPAAMDVVLVPLLAFDPRGHRLGHGGGYYDASFAFLRDAPRPSRPLLIGVGYGFQGVDELEPAAWDVRLDYIATDRTLINCNPQDEP